jgi:hypothetical protein
MLNRHAAIQQRSCTGVRTSERALELEDVGVGLISLRTLWSRVMPLAWSTVVGGVSTWVADSDADGNPKSHLASQLRAAVVRRRPRGGRARERRERLQPHVARHDQVLLVFQVQLAKRRILRTSGQRGSCAGTRSHAGAPRSEEPASGMHSRRRPRSTHLLGNARERSAPALQCSLARHLGQFDRLGGLVRLRRR